MSRKTANDIAWEKLFKEHALMDQVNQHGFVDINSNLIRQYREPRLMCKIDFIEAVPAVFKENHLSVLALMNGKYRIARTNPFLRIDGGKLPQKPTGYFYLPGFLQTLTADNITSEAKALNAAHASGMLSELASEDLFLTLSGRTFSDAFSFGLLDKNNNVINYDINGVQIEVDGGYESKRALLLVEAKMGSTTNMNIRQLLYPQLNYEHKINKEVLTYFMFYIPGGEYYFLPFVYKNGVAAFLYEGAKLYKLLSDESFGFEKILETPVNKYETGFNAPFPQADRLDKILEVFYLLGEKGEATKEELFEGLDFVPRQWDYYLNALVWLGLIVYDKESRLNKLSDLGSKLILMPERKRLLKIGQIAFSNEVFNCFLENDEPVVIDDRLLRINGLNPEATTTFRRFRTIVGWRNFLKRALA